VTETLGTFLLTFLYLTQTERKTKLSHDPAITTMILAACYVGGVLMVGCSDESGYAVLNPAIGMCTIFVMLFNA
jgi:hypothetical protein